MFRRFSQNSAGRIRRILKGMMLRITSDHYSQEKFERRPEMLIENLRKHQKFGVSIRVQGNLDHAELYSWLTADVPPDRAERAEPADHNSGRNQAVRRGFRDNQNYHNTMY